MNRLDTGTLIGHWPHVNDHHDADGYCDGREWCPLPRWTLDDWHQAVADLAPVRPAPPAPARPAERLAAASSWRPRVKRWLLIAGAVLLALAALGAIMGPPAEVKVSVCTEEDGSDPDQRFPCFWDATKHGNGRGHSYILTQPDN